VVRFDILLAVIERLHDITFQKTVTVTISYVLRNSSIMFMYIFICVCTNNGVQTVQLICLKLGMLHKQ